MYCKNKFYLERRAFLAIAINKTVLFSLLLFSLLFKETDFLSFKSIRVFLKEYV
jgi:hypothetical protein